MEWRDVLQDNGISSWVIREEAGILSGDSKLSQTISCYFFFVFTYNRERMNWEISWVSPLVIISMAKYRNRPNPVCLFRNIQKYWKILNKRTVRFGDKTKSRHSVWFSSVIAHCGEGESKMWKKIHWLLVFALLPGVSTN